MMGTEAYSAQWLRGRQSRLSDNGSAQGRGEGGEGTADQQGNRVRLQQWRRLQVDGDSIHVTQLESRPRRC